MEQHDKHEMTRRDAETLKALGVFLFLLALPVLAGTFWAGHGFSQAVNLVSGLILGAIGVGFVLRSRTLRKRFDAR